MLFLAMAACDSEPASCPPEPCSSCELGYYGPSVIPDSATRVRVDSSDARAEASIWFLVGDPNAGTAQTLASETATELPHTFAIPPGTERITVNTGHGATTVAFDVCN